MTEEEYLGVADLLKRRTNQREYFSEARKSRDAYQQKMDTHLDELQDLQRRLYELGYKGQ